MKIDLLLKNTKAILNGDLTPVEIAIADGKIAAIGRAVNIPAERIIDVEGNITLPGIIDTHVHFREPGFTYKEDFSSGTKAAAAGGVTTILDMPNNRPLISNEENLKVKLESITSKSYVDFGIFGLILKDNIHEAGRLAEAGISGFKIYMNESVGQPIAGLDLFKAFQAVAKTGLRTAVHAEKYETVKRETEKVKASDREDTVTYAKSRPSVAEMEAISEATSYSQKAACKLHICHLSSKEGIEILRKIKANLKLVTAETCPHYLLLNSEDMRNLGSLMKVYPPIRFSEDSEALWLALQDGTVDIISSDHAPHTPEEKSKPMWDAPGGFPGVETSVPLMLTQINHGQLTLRRYIKLASENPAKAYGMYPRKGIIKVGSQADFTIVDMKREGIIKSELLHSKSKITPFDRWKIKGIPIRTILRGNIIMEYGEILDPPKGSIVKPDMD